MKTFKIVSIALSACLIFPATGHACQMLGNHASAKQHNMAHDGTPTCSRLCKCTHYKNDARDPRDVSKVIPPHNHIEGENHHHEHDKSASKEEKSG